MVVRRRSHEIREFLLAEIPDHPRDIASFAAKQLGMTRQAVNRHLRALVDGGTVVAEGSTKARRYSLTTTQEMQTYPLADLREDVVWRDFVSPRLKGLEKNIDDICHYGLTEMLNNAIDHSEGSVATVIVRRSAVQISLVVDDDGVGIFSKIQQACGLEDEKHAVLELAKGKLTTDPARHSGEGIFFTSRVFDEYSIMSGSLLLYHSVAGNDWLLENTDAVNGTHVAMEIATNTTRTIREVFDRFTVHEEGSFGFDITHVPVELASLGDDNLISRSQAKRLVARFDRFKRVILDFSDVEMIGQAFADEVFRVFRSQHPEIDLRFYNASESVQRMIAWAMTASGQDSNQLRLQV